MSTALLQGGSTLPSLRCHRAAKGAQHARGFRPARDGCRLNVSCAAAGAEAVKDKRVPVTVLTGFLGYVLRMSHARVRPHPVTVETTATVGTARVRKNPKVFPLSIPFLTLPPPFLHAKVRKDHVTEPHLER